MPKRTKIVATISSINCDVEFLKKLYEAGMDVARLNTAHMSIDDATQTVRNIRSVSDKIAIMIDTKGPEVRTGTLIAPICVKTGDKLLFTPLHGGGDVELNYPLFAKYVNIGNRILIDDGELELVVCSKSGNKMECLASNDGCIKSRKSVNFPSVSLPLPSLTARDREFIDFAIKAELAYIAHSFVRSRDDVLAVRSVLESSDSHIGIIAKIENRRGVENIEEIIEASDGIMVARGDLGVEIPLEEVPQIQKQIILQCMKHHKPVITATQMLQSMQENPRPTRAEVSDVANAVFDGSDAVMLSGETSAGKYPLESVKMMASIIRQVESADEEHFIRVDEVDVSDNPIRGDVVKYAVELPKRLPVKAVIGLTETGDSARIAAAYRGKMPAYFSSPNQTIVRQLALCYGVYAYHHKFQKKQEKAFDPLIAELLKDKRLEEHDLVACLSSYPNATTLGTNFCSVITVDALREQTQKK